MTPRQRVLKKWPHAALIRPGAFVNAPDDPHFYVSTRHVRQMNGHYGGELIGQGSSAKAAWAKAADSIRRSSTTGAR